ncbi:MAG: parallel beta-helix domain-containing protein [Candidatus Hydrogenedentota bacterium]
MKTYVAGIALAFVIGAAAGAAVIGPSADVQEKLQEALILAEPGATVELAAGTFNFTRSLSLDVNNVTIKGAGINETILSFKGQNAGSEGLIVTSDGVSLRDFAVEDTIGDAIKAKGSNQISFINVRTEWTGGPKETNGAYGFYPVESQHVLIDGCVAIGASDAGIYVGQSRNVVVRNSTARFNVAGIEIENCYDADVYKCTAEHNTGGILVFDLPNLPQQGGHNVRVFDNKVVNNDTKNFAPAGNIVGNVPTGTGVMIMANRQVEVFKNTIGGNDTANVMIIAYAGAEGEAKDPKYYPYPEGINIHSNEFGVGGRNPQGIYGTLMAAAAGAPLPDVVWDGRLNREKLVGGKLPKDSNIYVSDNKHSGENQFANLDIDAFRADPKTHKVQRDISAHKGGLSALPGVKLPQDS